MKVSSLNKMIGNNLEKFASRKWLKAECEKGLAQPVKFAAAMMVTSIVSKDLIGCAVYTTQSWNNEKIPENKRKFVAMTDLMNGIIMVGGQFIAGKIIERKLGPALLAKYFTGEKEIVNKAEGTISKALVSHSEAPFAPNKVYGKYLEVLEGNKTKLKSLGLNVDDPKEIKAVGDDIVAKLAKDGKNAKAIAGGFTIIVAALGTMALVKRTLAPLLSTPLAGWVKNKYIDKKPATDNLKTEKTEKKEEQPKQNLDDKLLSHEVAPWNHSNKDGDKATFSKIKQN